MVTVANYKNISAWCTFSERNKEKTYDFVACYHLFVASIVYYVTKNNFQALDSLRYAVHITYAVNPGNRTHSYVVSLVV